MQKQEPDIFYPTSQKEWRQWLQENHASQQSVWLVYYKKETNKPTVSWSDAVDEALCFGWIDSKKISIDKETSRQFFSKRKAKSTWSKINKNKTERLIANGLMTKIGFESIEIAKQNGSWTVLDNVEELIIPNNLEKAFKANPGSKDFFLSLSKSTRKGMLQWIALAKQTETIQRRVNEIAELASQKLKPKQFT